VLNVSDVIPDESEERKLGRYPMFVGLTHLYYRQSRKVLDSASQIYKHVLVSHNIKEPFALAYFLSQRSSSICLSLSIGIDWYNHVDLALNAWACWQGSWLPELSTQQK
jgi:hypothetical protein